MRLKVGGRLTYSTCSFNPIENEAVVASVLEKYRDSIRLIDVSGEVSKFLKYRPGLTKWRVFHKARGKMNPSAWYTEWGQVPEQRQGNLEKTMFHPVYTHKNNSNKKQEDPLHLSRCLRFYPHDDNQGGFFVAVLERTSDDKVDSSDLWECSKVRQMPILDELASFSSWFENEYKQYCD
jgi:16S rRNA C967 or C1407 C5-methylase (RsmB/RsmF family)